MCRLDIFLAMVTSSLLMSSVFTHRLGPLPAARPVVTFASPPLPCLGTGAPQKEVLEVGAGQPVVEQRVDVGDGGLNLLLPGPHEIKDAELHGVVVQLGLVDDAFPQG